MSDPNDNVRVLDPSRKLAEAVRSVKNAEADRDDVVIEMRDAERMRLEILANELGPIIQEVPTDLDLFDFALSSGLKPRFWIDGVSHVSMSRDKRTYRFLKDTRNGRVILAESTDPKPVADQVTRYIAERMVERERMLEGGTPLSYRASVSPKPISRYDEPKPLRETSAPVATTTSEPLKAEPVIEPTQSGWKSFVWGLMIFILGGLFGLAMLANYLWDRIAHQ
ncbi:MULTISPECIES: hypothetical protein [Mesorhizobium]|uniref:Uncharacterized protein n=1 Tax=Mesorhizobium denitrificans TaxID=2294114 RepID=A0A371XJS9_9HYPH|nr:MULTISPECIES: hypothetical protein [Mesorhizobium]RFC69488.1 hypothetical protein DY251_01810 [Mesorhizobium denitrificans]